MEATLAAELVLPDAIGLLGEAIELRRSLHAQPELGLSLPHTQQLVLEALQGLGLQLWTGTPTTWVLALLEGALPGPTTLLRADMDALPMPEDTGLPYASKVDGVMHACGHDAHVAMLAGAAKLLARHREQVPGRVIFMFQPGEEGHGGAKVMLDEGLLERHGHVDRAFAVHISSVLPSGSIFARGGTLMASADEFRIVVTGRGGHASMPHDAIDPMPVACEIVTSLQAMLTRRVPAFDPAVLTIAHISGGTTFNVIPETVTLEGTARAVTPGTRELVLERLREVAEHIAAAHLCTAEVSKVLDGYPVTVNDPGEAQKALETAAKLFGAERSVVMPAPLMGAEDWSYVLARVPGCMAFLGAMPPGTERPAPNHSNRFIIDEEAMAAGIAMYAAMGLG
ncbi:MAG TPA: M20 family metallopeptidase [Acidimicrobiales bacterium]|nr:M20 family metallopeptidase [Acidimicrobiales bacterium]